MEALVYAPYIAAQLSDEMAVTARHICVDLNDREWADRCRLMWAADSVGGAAVSRIHDVLNWREADQIFDELLNWDLLHAAGHLRAMLSYIRQCDESFAALVREYLVSLPTHSLLRVVLAPETIRRACYFNRDSAATAIFFVNSLIAEHLLNGDVFKRDRSEGYWTALGDFHMRCSVSDRSKTPPTFPCVRNIIFQAPRLGELIPIDFRSSYRAQLPTSSCDHECFSSSEESDVFARLNDVFALINVAVPAAGALTTRFVKVIILHKSAPYAHGSSSARSWPGRVIIRNPQMADGVMIVSSLVHESIHQFLYVIEFLGRFVSLSEPGAVVKSPWTGRTLRLHSYVHACFVWYGLTRFWQLASESGVFPASSAAAQLAKAASGFNSGNPADHLIPHKQFIRRGIIDTIAALHACVVTDRLFRPERASLACPLSVT